MKKSSLPLIEYIPQFIDYCKQKGLSKRTQIAYNQFLKNFVAWLKQEGKEIMLPHQLSLYDLEAYRAYIATLRDKKGNSIKKNTQSLYLIAVRAFLKYLRSKDLTSLTAEDIKIPEFQTAPKIFNFLTFEQIKRLLEIPNIKTNIGLRDRAILEILISTGLKIGQLISLNRDQLNEIPGEALYWVKKYLITRKDNEKALFINYRGKKNISKRLTIRSVERTISKYGKIINLTFPLTPEVLRWARVLALLNKKIKISYPQTHKLCITRNYKIPILSYSSYTNFIKNSSPSWHTVEDIINKEVIWLKNSISTLPINYKEYPPFIRCNDCLLRKIAILIVSGKSQTIEYRAEDNKNLWNSLTEKLNLKKLSRHGKEWHKKMMDVIYEYFKQQNYKIVFEPILNYGRADLGIDSERSRPIFIEVGTVSLFKLWYNLSSMKNATFLIVPSENKVIEFNTNL